MKVSELIYDDAFNVNMPAKIFASNPFTEELHQIASFFYGELIPEPCYTIDDIKNSNALQFGAREEGGTTCFIIECDAHMTNEGATSRLDAIIAEFSQHTVTQTIDEEDASLSRPIIDVRVAVQIVKAYLPAAASNVKMRTYAYNASKMAIETPCECCGDKDCDQRFDLEINDRHTITACKNCMNKLRVTINSAICNEKG